MPRTSSPPDRGDATPPDYSPSTVVGIGASAGGVTALKSLLGLIPDDTGLAFVVVLHLSPEQPSSLAQILQSETAMPVMEVNEDLTLRPNQVFVLPPGHNLASLDTHLRLAKIEADRKERAPIDHFFSSLAENSGILAVGVLLSGTGCDGTVGLARIREAGGFALVQDPSEAQEGGMPQSAIANAVVDRILTVAEIPKALEGIAFAHVSVRLPEDGEETSPDARRVLQKIHAQIRLQTGHDFHRYKPSTIIRRIRRRMQLSRAGELDTYLQILRRSPNEVIGLANDLLITVTSFFRDAAVFSHLEKKVIPELFSRLGNRREIRVWTVGCATGEEAYSLAILLLEASGRLARHHPPEIQIFASDLHTQALARAREGYYQESIAADLSPSRLNRFFVRERSGFRIRKEVRELVVFAPHNLLRDPPFSRLDLITCRNLLIYLQREVQQDAISLFHYALRESGYLLLGTSESIDDLDLFRALHPEHNIFERRDHRRSDRDNRYLATGDFAASERAPAPGHRHSPATIASLGSLHQRMVELYAPPSVLLNQDHNIVHYSAHAGRYLTQPGGEPTNNLFKRVREELRVELRSCLYAIEESGRATRSKTVVLQNGSEHRRVSLRVQSPLDAEMEGYLLIFFDELPEQEETEPDTGAAESVRVRELETELEVTEKRLQAVIEDYENGQEDMRASNEELQSANEELRSTMEELETSKEELQSMNEELATVNQENRHKVEELSMMTSDLQNLLASTDVATLFLDREFRVLRFTPQVEELFAVRQTDRGRPLSDFTHKLGYDSLTKDAESVLRSLQPIHREVQSEDGRWYFLRLLPYRNVEDRIEGVVVTLVEITALKSTEERLRAREKDLSDLTADLANRVAKATETVRQLASNLALAEQRERTRIAQVLHDDLQQLLVSLQMRLHLAMKSPGNAGEELALLSDELRQAIDLTRSLTVDLSPPVLRHEGFVPVLGWLASRMRELYEFTVAVEAPEVFPPLGSELQILLFQIVREILFNAVKHAGVKEAEVRLTTADGRIHIEITDHGAGFDPDEELSRTETSTGFGLRTVMERIELFGGEVDIESVRGERTCVRVMVPEPTSSRCEVSTG